MSDDELIDFLAIRDYPADIRAKFIAAISPERRALFDKMKEVERWDQEGQKGPMPENVILCRDHSHER